MENVENNENAVQQDGAATQNEGGEGTVAQVVAVDAGTPVVEGEVITAAETAAAEAPALEGEVITATEAAAEEVAQAADEAPVEPAANDTVAEAAGEAPAAEEAAAGAVVEAPAEAAPETPAAEEAEGQA